MCVQLFILRQKMFPVVFKSRCSQNFFFTNATTYLKNISHLVYFLNAFSNMLGWEKTKSNRWSDSKKILPLLTASAIQIEMLTIQCSLTKYAKV